MKVEQRQKNEELILLITDKVKSEGGHIKLVNKLRYAGSDVEFTDIISNGDCKFTIDGSPRNTPLKVKSLFILELIWKEIQNNKFL